MVNLLNISQTGRTAPKTAFSSIRASFLAALIERFEAQERSAQPLLNRVGITTAQLSDPYGAIPLPLFVAFLEAAAEMTDDPFLGARIGTGLKAADMGPVGLILSLSASVERGMTRIARYVNALQGGTQSQWIEDRDQFVFSYRIADGSIWPRRQDAEFSLASLTQVIRDNFSSRFAPLEVHFEHPAPDDPTPLERLFRAPLRYLQPINRLVIARPDAIRVMRQEDQGLLATLERHVRDLIGEATPLGDTTSAARAVIDANLGLTAITLDRVAAALHLGPRTLQRRLAAEGTSLRSLLDALRHERAARLLEQPGARVGQVAQALGYTDPTAFWRAWRGWTGEAPSTRRRN
ncbi:AraC family transcriptional regulator [Phaeobacter sp. HF9A]|uniref:AraC family transcriptional regulator n=1 Tax=Phaeobacter sp. HF9A TaxID=2721561 RepID=UPI001430C6E7|nr:AraC family transcriptional regulator [Phaeobacter sp. HF9A]NIZ12128.1 AraC family transcriptional regulator [Phaeobacter sp. HF9A]